MTGFASIIMVVPQKLELGWPSFWVHFLSLKSCKVTTGFSIISCLCSAQNAAASHRGKENRAFWLKYRQMPSGVPSPEGTVDIWEEHSTGNKRKKKWNGQRQTWRFRIKEPTEIMFLVHGPDFNYKSTFSSPSLTESLTNSLLLLLLLLLSHFSRVRLCATPESAADQAPLFLGFSRQEHWSGLLFPSPMHESEVAQSCPTLSDPMGCSPPGSSVHGIFQARVLEWGAIAFSALIA